MTQVPARDALTIFIDGDEVPGLIVYGLLPPGTRHAAMFPSSAWIAQPEAATFTLHGSGWEVFGWEVPIVIWPTDVEFQEAGCATMSAMIRGGSRVAWIGAEGVPFCDPPELFSPDCMSGGVLGWMTDAGDFGCELDPDAPLSPVADDVLLRLRGHAKGLADAT